MQIWAQDVVFTLIKTVIQESAHRPPLLEKKSVPKHVGPLQNLF